MNHSPKQRSKGVEKVSFGYRQLLAHQAKLLVTEWVIGVVLFQGAATTWGLGGGEAACARQARRLELQKKHEASVKESAKTQQFAAEVQILKSTLYIDIYLVSALGH